MGFGGERRGRLASLLTRHRTSLCIVYHRPTYPTGSNPGPTPTNPLFQFKNIVQPRGLLMRVRLTLRSGNSISRPQLCGIIKRPLGPRGRHCAHVHAGLWGLFVRQTNRFTAGGSNSRRVRSFCFDSIARDVPLPPQSSARLFAQKAEAGSTSPPQFIVTAATIKLPTRKPEPGAGRGRATRSFHLSFQKFV